MCPHCIMSLIVNNQQGRWRIKKNLKLEWGCSCFQVTRVIKELLKMFRIYFTAILCEPTLARFFSNAKDYFLWDCLLVFTTLKAHLFSRDSLDCHKSDMNINEWVPFFVFHSTFFSIYLEFSLFCRLSLRNSNAAIFQHKYTYMNVYVLCLIICITKWC